MKSEDIKVGMSTLECLNAEISELRSRIVALELAHYLIVNTGEELQLEVKSAVVVEEAEAKRGPGRPKNPKKDTVGG